MHLQIKKVKNRPFQWNCQNFLNTTKMDQKYTNNTMYKTEEPESNIGNFTIPTHIKCD